MHLSQTNHFAPFCGRFFLSWQLITNNAALLMNQKRGKESSNFLQKNKEKDECKEESKGRERRFQVLQKGRRMKAKERQKRESEKRQTMKKERAKR